MNEVKTEKRGAVDYVYMVQRLIAIFSAISLFFPFIFHVCNCNGSFTALSYIQMGRQKGCSQAKKIFALGANMHREHFSRSEFIFMLVLFCYITQGAAGIADCDDAR